jgi:hypothetical protein
VARRQRQSLLQQAQSRRPLRRHVQTPSRLSLNCPLPQQQQHQPLQQPRFDPLYEHQHFFLHFVRSRFPDSVAFKSLQRPTRCPPSTVYPRFSSYPDLLPFRLGTFPSSFPFLQPILSRRLTHPTKPHVNERHERLGREESGRKRAGDSWSWTRVDVVAEGEGRGEERSSDERDRGWRGDLGKDEVGGRQLEKVHEYGRSRTLSGRRRSFLRFVWSNSCSTTQLA